MRSTILNGKKYWSKTLKKNNFKTSLIYLSLQVVVLKKEMKEKHIFDRCTVYDQQELGTFAE